MKAQLHLVMTTPPNTLKWRIFQCVLLVGKFSCISEGGKSGLVWNDAGNTPLTKLFLMVCVYVVKTTDSRELPPMENFGQNCFISCHLIHA